MIESKQISHISGRDVKPLVLTAQDVADAFNDLELIGVKISADTVRRMMDGQKHLQALMAQDSLQPTVTTPSINTPIQFLQSFLPGFVEVITAARRADVLMGITTIGDWADEEIVQGILEMTGLAIPYADQQNVPYSSWNTNFVRRTIIRFEEGMRVGTLDEERAAKMRVNSADAKRRAAAKALEISRNYTGFYGFASGANLTYGFLNDPGLAGYVNAPNGGWEAATFLEIQQDILTALADLRDQSGDNIDPKKTPITLAVSTNRVDFLTTPPVYGAGSVLTWLKENYPNVRVESAPELNNANSNQNVFYLYAERMDDGGTDDGQTWLQAVPAKFKINGVAKLAKGYEEDYSNGTAGAFCKRPFLVVRYTGI